MSGQYGVQSVREVLSSHLVLVCKRYNVAVKFEFYQRIMQTCVAERYSVF